MDLESGDYFRTNSDLDLQAEVQRLQSYAQTLRNKLETEKVWLASLKSETQLMLAQRGSPFPDGCHLPQCPMSKQESSSNLSHLQTMPSNHQMSHVPTVQSHPEYFMQDRSHLQNFPLQNQPLDVFNAGNMYQAFSTSDPSLCSLPSDEMQKFMEKQNYFQKVIELDNMCKQEMARISQVGYELEPLNQIASDWDFQAQLSNPKTPVKDYISMAIAGFNAQNQGTDDRLFVQSSNTEEKIESVRNQLEADHYSEQLKNTDANRPSKILKGINKKSNVIDEVKLSLARKANKINVETTNSISPHRSEECEKPSTLQTDLTSHEKDTKRKKVILKKDVTVLPLKEEVDYSTPAETPIVICDSLQKPKNQPKSSEKAHVTRVHKNDVDPIVWGRLAVDKKKRSLKHQSSVLDSVSKENTFAKNSSSNNSDSDSSEDDANSGHNHFTSAVEREFLRQYMYSDSDYVYSPLFVTESEEST